MGAIQYAAMIMPVLLLLVLLEFLVSRKKGIDAYGLNAKDITSVYGLRVHAREKLARVKAVLDIVFNKKPHFLGDKIELK